MDTKMGKKYLVFIIMHVVYAKILQNSTRASRKKHVLQSVDPFTDLF